MDEPVSRGPADPASRLLVLERNDRTQDDQLKDLFQRMGAVERQQSAQGATLQSMQVDISETKTTTHQTNEKVDKILMWMLGIAATTAVTAVLTLIQLVTKKP